MTQASRQDPSLPSGRSRLRGLSRFIGSGGASTTDRAEATDAAAVRDICPYLESADRAWRSGTPSRDHRCMALAPPAVLAQEKQRRLCLTASHRSCTTHAAALSAAATRRRQPDSPAEDPSGRPYARTAPVVLDHGRLGVAIPAFAGRRAIGRALLVGLLAIAFIALLATRIGPLGTGPAADVQPTPFATTTQQAASPTVTPSQTPDPTSSASPLTESPTPIPTSTPAASSTATPTAPTAPATYKVRSGDTLGGIATRFGTTVKILKELNGISDPSKIRVGQVLKLP